jgi:ORF6N domain
MFQLTGEELDALNRSQIATGSQKHRDPRFPPYAFTEHGTVMLANVLKSHTAIHASIQVVRAFVRLRELLGTHKDLAEKLEALEKKYDRQFKIVFDAIRQLMKPEAPPKQQRIGF